jgi:hypothetical protein
MEERMALSDNSKCTPSSISYRCGMTTVTGGDSMPYLGDETYMYSPSSGSTLSRKRGLRRSTASSRTYSSTEGSYKENSVSGSGSYLGMGLVGETGSYTHQRALRLVGLSHLQGFILLLGVIPHLLGVIHLLELTLILHLTLLPHLDCELPLKLQL